MLLNFFLPLINFVMIGLFGRFLGAIGSMYFTLYVFALLNIDNSLLILSAFFLQYNINYEICIGDWLTIGLFDVQWTFLVDDLSSVILCMVSFISLLIHVYSFAYMKVDPYLNRFISYLSLFTFFIIILVTAGNFVQLFLGWEGVGVCSYLLINFWSTRVQANKAALKALIMNRLGDIGLIVAIASVFIMFYTFDFTTLQGLVSHIGVFNTRSAWFVVELESLLSSSSNSLFSDFYIDGFFIICFGLIIAMIGKSAQIGLHTWLPAAIEGPTPVSALIHAATMVTAGIFLLIRTSFFFTYSISVQYLIIIIGIVTALLSAITACFLYDIKKVIAYSTCSQLGYIAVACGLAQYHIGFFHLINHAFFKALLFLTAGAIIHSFNEEQDIRKLGGLFFKSPVLYSAILIGNIAIMGIPFLSGFFSKDIIIEIVYLTTNNLWQIVGLNINFIYIFIIGATLCTALYSSRLYYFLFLRQGVVNTESVFNKYITQTQFIRYVLVLLIVGSIIVGFVLSDFFSVIYNFFGMSHTIYQDETLVLGSHTVVVYFQNEYLPLYLKLIPLYINLSVIFIITLIVYIYQYQFLNNSTTFLLYYLNYYGVSLHRFIIYRFKTKGWYNTIRHIQFNFYYNEYYNYLALGQFYRYYCDVFLNLDKGILELIGPQGLSQWYYQIIKFFRYFYAGSLHRHLFFIYTSILGYILLIEFWI